MGTEDLETVEIIYDDPWEETIVEIKETIVEVNFQSHLGIRTTRHSVLPTGLGLKMILQSVTYQRPCLSNKHSDFMCHVTFCFY